MNPKYCPFCGKESLYKVEEKETEKLNYYECIKCRKGFFVGGEQ